MSSDPDVTFGSLDKFLTLSKLHKMSDKSKNANSKEFQDSTAKSLIVKPITIEEKPKSIKFKSSLSENNLKIGKGIKEKIVSRVKSWSNRDKYEVNKKVDLETHLAQTSTYCENETLDEVVDSNLARARGSLESLLRDEQTMPKDDLRSRSCFSASETREKSDPVSPKSSPLLEHNTKPNSKFIFWDPFDKRGRKNKKELNRKKKKNKNHEQQKKETTLSIPAEGKTCPAKTGKKTNENSETRNENETVEAESSFKSKYFPKSSKSVVFTNEVFVVYFNGNDFVYESKEPLKKDTEQQVRNKEMRQGHLMKAQEKYNLCLY